MLLEIRVGICASTRYLTRREKGMEAHFKGDKTGRLQMREGSALRNVKGHCNVNSLAHEDGESQLGSHRGRLERKEYLLEHSGKWGICMIAVWDAAPFYR